MTGARKIKTFSDLDTTEHLYPHCIRCHKTGDALDVNKLTANLGRDVPLTVIKKLLVCKHCGQNDKIIFRLKSNQTMPTLSEEVIR